MGGNELKVVDEDGADVLLVFQAACFGAQFQNIDGAGVVDEDFGGLECFGCLADIAPLGGGDMLGAEVIHGDARDGAEDTKHQLEGRHFQTEEDDGDMLGAQGNVGGHVQGQCGLSDGGACRQNKEIAGAQAGNHLVEVKSRLEAHGSRIAPDEHIQIVDGLASEGLHGQDVLFLGGVGDVEEFLFNAVQQGGDIVIGVIAFEDSVRTGGDEAAEYSRLLHNFDVVFDVCGGRYGIHQLHDVFAASGLFELAFAFQVVGEDDDVHGCLALAAAEFQHGVKDNLVGGTIEGVFHLERAKCDGGSLGGEQHGAEDGDFRLDVAGLGLVKCLEWRGGGSRIHGLLPMVFQKQGKGLYTSISELKLALTLF